ncbi:MAG TPA: protein kinase [Mycobacteriales bacterium]|jgi:serine/threonine-protein kinase|nr:protein kinase [Mycobacteriales bacterium]
MTLAPDFTLGGRYQLQQRIAIGGMGEVWRASDSLLGRAVAVKVLKPEYAADPHFLERFRNEARHTASLSHPGIANVFDYGEVGDKAYLVMELVDGEPLSTVLARDGRLTAASTLDIVGQAALALQAAHEAGVIHRDVKPGNILIRPDGVVKVTDFGIARVVDAAPVTQTGMVVGTAAYLSPEQASGRPTTAASDVYSLGVVAFECLTGERPFHADSAVGVAMAHATATPPPLPKDVPPLVGDFVLRAMEKDPARRHPSAGDFGRTALALATQLQHDPTAGKATAGFPAVGGDTRLMTASADTPQSAGAASVADASADAAAARHQRKVRNSLVAIGAAVVLLGFLLLRSCSGPAYVSMPAVVGTSYAKAAATLAADGLHADRRAVRSTTARPGTVIRQSERAGTRLTKGTTVTLTVAAAPKTVQVRAADLVGRRLADVQQELTSEHLRVAVVSAPSRAPAGTVTAVAPTGALREGSTVTVTVAAAAPPDKPKHGHHGHGD